MEQPDLFGGSEPVVTKVRWPIQAADATRTTGFTCWNDCGHCDPVIRTQSGTPVSTRIYRVCQQVGCKCFPKTDICKWATCIERSVRAPVKPPDPAWVDY